MPERVITYIDGFNFYYGLKGKKWKRYYWIDLAAMSRALLKPNQELVACHYFTARIRQTHAGQSTKKQKIWLEALETQGDIVIHYGHYLLKSRRCRSCGETWDIPEEKMTDVNIATQLLVDAYEDNFDTAILISGDSDFSTPIQEILSRFPNKKIIVAFPPKRSSEKLKKITSGFFVIGEGKLKGNLLPRQITKPDGYTLTCPQDWMQD